MTALTRIREAARANLKKIALPEADEPRTMQAAAMATRERLARIFLVTADPGSVRTAATNFGVDLTGVDIVEAPPSGREHERASEASLDADFNRFKKYYLTRHLNNIFNISR